MNEVGPASDIFSLGVMFYELLTGQCSFQAKSIPELLRQVISSEPPAPSQLRSGIDGGLETVCLKMLAKRPADRYESMQQVADVLTAAIQPQPPRASAANSPGNSGRNASDKIQPADRPRQSPSRWLLAASAAAVLVLAILILPWRSTPGTLLVDVDQADADVKVINEHGVVDVIGRSAGSAVRLSVSPRSHRLLIEKDGFQAFADNFAVAACQTERRRARLNPIPAVPPPATESQSPRAGAEPEVSADRFLAEWVLEIGGKVEIRLAGTSQPVQLKDLLPSRPFTLTQINLRKTLHLDAAHLARLAELPELVYLNLSFTNLDDSLLAVIPSLPTLEYLDLSWSRLTPAGLGHLRHFRHLKTLSLDGCPLPESAANEISLKDVQKLERLWLQDTRVTEGTITAHVARLTKLKTLGLSNGQLTDQGLRALAGLTELESLLIMGTSVTDESLPVLQSFAKLSSLWLNRTSMTSLGLRALHAALPKCRIEPPPAARQSALAPPLVGRFDADEAASLRSSWATYLGVATSLLSPSGIQLRLVPPGIYSMGIEPELKAKEAWHGPQHAQVVSHPLWVAESEVTQALYERVMSTNPSQFSRTGKHRDRIGDQDTSDFPVEGMTWYDAITFCNQLSALEQLRPIYQIRDPKRGANGAIISATVAVDETSGGYRLPTEAEWEYACRAGTTTPFNYGKDAAEFAQHARCHDSTGRIGPEPVAKLRPNAWGLYDTHGNVCEWCVDPFNGSPYDAASSQAEAQLGPSIERAVRGGSWGWLPARTAAGLRSGFAAGQGLDGIGIRLVRRIPREPVSPPSTGTSP